MTILPMSQADLPEVVHLAEQLGYPCSLERIETRFTNINSSHDYALFVAKNETHQVVGYIQINIEPHTLLADLRAEISALVVDQQQRSLGIGAKLLAQAESWAKNKGITLIRLRSNTKRTDAHRFYEKNGYKILKSWHSFTKDLI